MMLEFVKARRACFIVGISSPAPYRDPAPDKDGPLKAIWATEWRMHSSHRSSTR